MAPRTKGQRSEAAKRGIETRRRNAEAAAAATHRVVANECVGLMPADGASKHFKRPGQFGKWFLRWGSCATLCGVSVFGGRGGRVLLIPTFCHRTCSADVGMAKLDCSAADLCPRSGPDRGCLKPKGTPHRSGWTPTRRSDRGRTPPGSSAVSEGERGGSALGPPEGRGEESKEDRGVGALAVEVGLTVRLRRMAGPIARLRYLK